MNVPKSIRTGHSTNRWFVYNWLSQLEPPIRCTRAGWNTAAATFPSGARRRVCEIRRLCNAARPWRRMVAVALLTLLNTL
jgi:hypothetical protein